MLIFLRDLNGSVKTDVVYEIRKRAEQGNEHCKLLIDAIDNDYDIQICEDNNNNFDNFVIF